MLTQEKEMMFTLRFLIYNGGPTPQKLSGRSSRINCSCWNTVINLSRHITCLCALRTCIPPSLNPYTKLIWPILASVSIRLIEERHHSWAHDVFKQSATVMMRYYLCWRRAELSCMHLPFFCLTNWRMEESQCMRWIILSSPLLPW